MTRSYVLSEMEPNTFEHLVNVLALRVLGPGLTGFAPGSDGGRDGYFEGEAPYPSQTDRWSGRWYIQSKFHKPHLSKNAQKWLLAQIKSEIDVFQGPSSRREWPDNWIVATNVDPSGAPGKGTFDQARTLVENAHPELASHFHIWGGQKILDLLASFPDVASHYAHFLTPGNVIAQLISQMSETRGELETIVRFLVIKQFVAQQHTKLEQAGSPADTRPGIHRLFTDLPFISHPYNLKGNVMDYLIRAAAQQHKVDGALPDSTEWRLWRRHPSRARVWFIKGGPGQGKSTLAQYLCQIQRAALILQDGAPQVTPEQRTLAAEVKEAASAAAYWPLAPRIPISIELKEYAQWFGQRPSDSARGVLTYLAGYIGANVEETVYPGTLKRALAEKCWLIVFDGLDEVPSDVKDTVAQEVRSFLDHLLVECNSDTLAICTSRPQGYSGQFAEMDGPVVDLVTLSAEEALACAKPILALDRNADEAAKSYEILESAIESSAVRELMTTPLQSHIMAVVVRDGGRPPDRRWQLFANFYQVIKRREANRNLPNLRLAKLLREGDRLLKHIHNRLGFVLHSRAETSQGAHTWLERDEFRQLVRDTVSQLLDRDVDETIDLVMEATTERLVLVNTPEQGTRVRFDIRPLQEFFAAEYLYESVDVDILRRRLEVVAGDSHWNEVSHFLLSALVENLRKTELSVAIQVLERLNDGDDSGFSRIFSRRIGSGALLAARLLQEGVLESDKRIRQQFRASLLPILGSTSVGDLFSLVSVDQPNSRAWLEELLISAIVESHPSENVGAAIVLAHVLPDDSKHVNEVTDYLLAAQSSYRSFVLSCLIESDEPGVENFYSTWVVELALKSMLRPGWGADCCRGYFPALSVLDQNPKLISEAARKCGFSDALSDVASTILSSTRVRSTNSRKSEFSERVGILTLRYSKFEVLEKAGGWPPEVWSELAGSAGIMQCAYRILKFAQTQRAEDLARVLEFVEADPRILRALPSHLKAQLPLEGSAVPGELERLCALSDPDLREVLRERRTGYECIRLIERGMEEQWDLSDWRTTVERFPQWALMVWTSDPVAIRPRPSILDSQEALDLLIDKCINSPLILTSNVESWGALIRTRLERERDLRMAFLRASENAVQVGTSFGRISPFRLDLPQEATLLPHLANAMLNTRFRAGNRQDVEGLPELVKKMSPDIDALNRIANDSDQRFAVRAAAVLMSHLHADGVSDVKNVPPPSLTEFYNSAIGQWYLKGVGEYSELLGLHEQEQARRVIGELLGSARSDFEGRSALDDTLERWRQRSSAPVQSQLKSEIWN